MTSFRCPLSETRRTRLRLAGRVCLLTVLLAPVAGLMALVAAPCAWAAPPQLGTPAERIVQGIVLNSAGAPADNAVVYLQDTKTMVIRSYVANSGGHFHFNQLSPDTDYSVWAEVNKHRSKIRTVSMFSSHLKFTYTLKIKG